MTREQIVQALTAHHTAIGRCGHIQAEIDRLRQTAAHIRAQREADMAAPPVSRLDRMPRGSAAGQPTERIALALLDEAAFEASEAGAACRKIDAQIEALRREDEACRLNVRFVESWLAGLAERERCVIERRLIEGETWRDATAHFSARFGDEMSIDRMKRLLQRAIDHICDIAA